MHNFRFTLSQGPHGNRAMKGIKLSLLVLLVCSVVLTFVSGDETLYCCDFDDGELCDWENVDSTEFIWTGDEIPDLTDIDDFDKHTSDCMWLQNPNLTSTEYGDFSSPKVTLNDGDIISVEFYIHQQIIDGSFPVSLYFDDEFNRSTKLVLSKRNGWNQPLSAFCGGSNLCCQNYPCSGQVRVNGQLKNPGDLLAFDSVVINDCPPDPTTRLPTTAEPTTPSPTTVEPTPPPTSSFCCSFETGCPTWDILGWTLSVDSTPPFGNIPPFTYGSQYAWNEKVDAGKIISPIIYNVQEASTFTFNYYVYNSKQDVTNTLIAYFQVEDSTDYTYLTILSSTNGLWKPAAVVCTSCCETFPCAGRLILETSIGPGENLYAVDNIQVNGGCVDSPKCCQFEDSDICGIVNVDSSNTWKWSGSDAPNTSYLDDFTSDGDYLYYQRTSVPPNDNNQATLRTGLMTVNHNSTFDLSFYVETTDEKYPLTILFKRADNDRETVMEYASDTYDKWVSVEVACASLHGDCCYPDSKCNGFLEINAQVNTGGSNSNTDVFYAVDNIDVDSECEETRG